MKKVLVALLCAGLAGCSSAPASDFVTIAVPTSAPQLPPECSTAHDPAWRPWPPVGTEVLASDVLRRDDDNHSRFNRLRRYRSICAAAIAAAGQ